MASISGPRGFNGDHITEDLSCLEESVSRTDVATALAELHEKISRLLRAGWETSTSKAIEKKMCDLICVGNFPFCSLLLLLCSQTADEGLFFSLSLNSLPPQRTCACNHRLGVEWRQMQPHLCWFCSALLHVYNKLTLVLSSYNVVTKGPSNASFFLLEEVTTAVIYWCYVLVSVFIHHELIHLWHSSAKKTKQNILDEISWHQTWESL